MQRLLPKLPLLANYNYAFKLYDYVSGSFTFHSDVDTFEVTAFLKKFTNEINNFNDSWAVSSGLICFNDLNVATILKLIYDLGEIYEIYPRKFT